MNLEALGAQAHTLGAQKYEGANIRGIQVVGANHFPVSVADFLLGERQAHMQNFCRIKQTFNMVF